MKRQDITNEERQTVAEMGGPWMCNPRELADRLIIKPTRAAHIVMLMRGEDAHARETARYHIGERVTVNHPGEHYDGETATVIEVDPASREFPYRVQMGSVDDEGETLFWFGADELLPIAPSAQSEPVLGIGGIGVFTENEMPIIPSARAMARAERLEKTDIICRRCGASKNFDGAMFTTDASSGICDDCY